jgi:hypothetical protein
LLPEFSPRLQREDYFARAFHPLSVNDAAGNLLQELAAEAGEAN